MACRRALLAVAAVAVGSSIWNLSVGRISAIDMEIPDGAQKSVLLTALAYLAVTFVWHFFQDSWGQVIPLGVICGGESKHVALLYLSRFETCHILFAGLM